MSVKPPLVINVSPVMRAAVLQAMDAPVFEMTDRQARCSCMKESVPSDVKLPFFIYRGEGSRDATEICTCGYLRSAHTDEMRAKPHLKKLCNEFTPRGPHEFDSYYCGCRGWD